MCEVPCTGSAEFCGGVSYYAAFKLCVDSCLTCYGNSANCSSCYHLRVVMDGQCECMLILFILFYFILIVIIIILYRNVFYFYFVTLHNNVISIR
jgi:hypothetical protein